MPRDNRDNRRGGGKKNKLTKTMIVGPFRMAFPALLEPEEDDNGNERYKMTALFPPDYKGIREIEDALYEVMEAEFGPESQWPSGRNDILPEDKLYDAGKKDYNGFKKGWWALSMSAKDQPGVIDADKNEVMSKREVYGGRWARAQISITTYDNKSKGVGVYMNHVQLLEHDEAFSGRGSAEDAFDKYELDDRRGTGRNRRDRDDEEDTGRSSRRGGRDRDEDRDSRDGRDRGRDRGGRGEGRGRDRDRDDREENSSRSRRDEDDRGSRRDRDEDRRSSRDRDEPEDRRSSRGRDDDSDRKSSRNSSRDERDEDDKGSRRDTPRSRRDADEWN